MKCEHDWSSWIISDIPSVIMVEWCANCGVLKVGNIIHIPKNRKWKIIVSAANGYIIESQRIIDIKDVRDAQPDRTFRR